MTSPGAYQDNVTALPSRPPRQYPQLRTTSV